jgi:hypothetical protein
MVIQSEIILIALGILMKKLILHLICIFYFIYAFRNCLIIFKLIILTLLINLFPIKVIKGDMLLIWDRLNIVVTIFHMFLIFVITYLTD